MVNVLTRKLELFHSLSCGDKELLDIATKRRRHLPARTEIVRRGDMSNNPFLIVDGYACRCKLLRQGSRHIFACMLPGDLSDIDTQLLPASDHTITTLSDCTIVDISRQHLAEMLNSPRVAHALRCATLVDVAITREWLVNLGQRSAESRIGHFFCEFLFRLEAVGFAAAGQFRFPLTQAELGDVMGLSAVHVNRVLQSLRARGMIVLESGRLTITDLQGLWALSEFNPDYLPFGRMKPLASRCA